MAILFALYGTIAHGVQRFRTFQLVAGVLVATCLFITLRVLPPGARAASSASAAQEREGGDRRHARRPRAATTTSSARGPDAEPGLEYRCEHVGLFGTYSIEERVRYRGELHDPNEVALTISAGALSLLIAFVLRKRSPLERGRVHRLGDRDRARRPCS